jgi:hypothetical protein
MPFMLELHTELGSMDLNHIRFIAYHAEKL